MNLFRSLLCALAITSVAAFAPALPSQHLIQTRLLSDKQGGGTAFVTGTKIDQKVTSKNQQKSKSKDKIKKDTGGPSYKSPEEHEDPPMYQLILIGDAEYQKDHVVSRLQEIVKDVSEEEAEKLYKRAQKKDEAVLGKFPKETAEFHAEQLTRSEPIIYANIRLDE
mmetsp:Transcript_15640/g.32885  ORF Transcript_15640/g.32885 Transcript_15640/m.32885 type:complete len:166 (-) Transcript_15640:386-883(-)|eukprot:CAMPEP_0171333624 /NCGR_PEP_ID=MMETSP0878-20121228/4112_1 /TAXON_ID=67004 /ORGANISM="Thalassiosira weissflogii, Strain CCMP1336" /LENGTH=165 /DNA_ID=CAMNT_0011834571 /DNA_START=176 /DNA_END=673 /DNA_ORIENTATION=+